LLQLLSLDDFYQSAIIDDVSGPDHIQRLGVVLLIIRIEQLQELKLTAFTLIYNEAQATLLDALHQTH
jgi:hypothetical protein